MPNDSSQPASEESMTAVFEGLARGRHWELWIVETAPTPDWPDLAQEFPERFAQAFAPICWPSNWRPTARSCSRARSTKTSARTRLTVLHRPRGLDGELDSTEHMTRRSS